MYSYLNIFYIFTFFCALLILIQYLKINILKENFQNTKLSSKRNAHLNIIFIETNQTRKWLDFQQICSIESAALNNPSSNIYLYSLNAEFKNKYLLDEYKNIIFIKTNLEKIFKDTPFYEWWLNDYDVILTSPYVEAHLSDALRLCLLYKHGGIYSDLDTITIRSFEPLRKFVGVGYLYEFDGSSIGNGFLIFPQNHQLLMNVMKTFSKQYNPKKWSQNGPELLKKEIQQYCNVSDIYESLLYGIKKSLCDITILPQEYFYPYSWEEAEELFKANSSLDIKRFIRTYSIHFYGRYIFINNISLINLNVSNTFEFFSSFFCPRAYNKLLEKNKK